VNCTIGQRKMLRNVADKINPRVYASLNFKALLCMVQKNGITPSIHLPLSASSWLDDMKEG